MHIKKGDKVQVISGEDKGKVGEVLQAFPKENRVIVKDVNVQTRHRRASQLGEESGRFDVEGPIDVSNVALYSEELQKGVKTHMEFIDGKKVRVSNKTDEKFD